MSTCPEESTTVHDFEPTTRTMRDDILEGLAKSPKQLPSQYLYDARGAVLFERICETQDYYITRAEKQLLKSSMPSIAARIGRNALILEPGVGSGEKTEVLLGHLKEPAGFVPIDVSKEQLIGVAERLHAALPEIEILPICADFLADYHIPDSDLPDCDRRVAFFPGSTIGNFLPEVAVEVLVHLKDLCSRDGGILIGVDLKKDRRVLEAAYDDSEGVSREFAMNYLERMNQELNADFDLDQFDYEAPFNEAQSRIEMALVSLADQTVRIAGTPVAFRQGERIRTEVSYKFDEQALAAMAGRAGLSISERWIHPDVRFGLYYLV